MLILALDSSSSNVSLAVLRGHEVLGSVSSETRSSSSSSVFRQLDALLKKVSLRVSDFDLFAVVAGPGSFTGLRVGLAAVKGWAEVYAKPIAAVSALEAVAAQSNSSEPLLVPVLDARRGQIYFGFYRRSAAAKNSSLALEEAECVMTREEFVEILRSRCGDSGAVIVTTEPALVSSSISEWQARADCSAQISIESVSDILAPHVGRLAYARARRGELTDALTLDANYVRRSDAELHLKGPENS